MAPYRVIFSPEAAAQLVAIYRRICSQTAPTIADRFTGAIVDYCAKLETFPQRGARRDDLRPGLRTIGFRCRVTIAFAVEADTDDYRRFLRRSGFRSGIADRRGVMSKAYFTRTAPMTVRLAPAPGSRDHYRRRLYRRGSSQERPRLWSCHTHPLATKA